MTDQFVVCNTKRSQPHAQKVMQDWSKNQQNIYIVLRSGAIVYGHVKYTTDYAIDFILLEGSSDTIIQNRRSLNTEVLSVGHKNARSIIYFSEMNYATVTLEPED